LKITTEDLGSRQVMLTIEVDEKRVDRALRGVARRISRNYSIPGFRRGRAPYHIVLQRFGREALLQETLDDLGQEVIQEALDEQNLEPYDAGTLEDIQLDPLILKLRVPLRPEVDLGDYRELRVEPPAVVVEEAEIEAELEKLRQDNAILEPADDRPARMGDWVSVDVAAELDSESLVQEQAYTIVLDAEDKEFDLGFAEQIVGMSVDEEKQFKLTLGENWGEEKAGQEASYTATLREVRSRTLPDLDDDLARTVGDFDTLDELRQDVLQQFEENAQREADSEYIEEVMEALLTETMIEYPPDLIEEQLDSMVEDLKGRLDSQGLSSEDYFKLTGQTEDAFRESLLPQAESIVRRGLAMGELARQEGLDVEGTEIEQRIALLSASWGERASEVRDMLSEPDSLRSIANSLLTDKAVQRLVAIAKGEAPSLEEKDDASLEESDAVDAGAEDLITDAGESEVVEQSAQELENDPAEDEETADDEADLSSETA
jgi:trigger factor